jgi:hypothetical protein
MTLHRIAQIDAALEEVERVTTERNRVLADLERMVARAQVLPARRRVKLLNTQQCRTLLDLVEALTTQAAHAIEEYNRLLDDAPHPAGRFRIEEW